MFMTIGSVVEKARRLCASGLFLLAFVAGPATAGDRDEIMAFIDRGIAFGFEGLSPVPCM